MPRATADNLSLPLSWQLLEVLVDVGVPAQALARFVHLAIGLLGDDEERRAKGKGFKKPLRLKRHKA